MSIFNDFDANAIETPKSDFELLPPANYPVRVMECEETETRNGDPGVKVTLEIIGGDYQSRRIWDRMWIKHSSEKFRAREQARFASFCKAVGVVTPQSTDEFLGLELVAKVKIEKSRDSQYEDQNRAQDYFASTTSITPSSPTPPTDKPKRAGSGDWKTQ